MRKMKSRSAPWSAPEAAGWSYRTGSPLCDGLGCCDPHRLAPLNALPASWRGCPQPSGYPEVKMG